MKNIKRGWDKVDWELYEKYVLTKKETVIQIRTTELFKKDVQEAINKRNKRKGTELTVTDLIQQNLINFIENEKIL